MGKSLFLNRRRALALVGAAGASALIRKADAATCLTTPAQTEGPYFVEENLNRSDIRVDPSDGTMRPGLPLTLQVNVSEVTGASCTPLSGARVEVWHCDAGGVYSDETANSSKGKKFLRGYQLADANGVVNFTTVYPGWYQGRAVHVHFKVRTYSGTTKLDEFTSQWFFDESITDAVHSQAPYNTRGQRDTRNTTDNIFTGTANNSRLMLNLTKTDQGYSATVDVGVNLKVPAVSKAVITQNGVVNAASFQSGMAPGAWITIFGENLAAAVRSVATSDLVNNVLPTSLGGISVKINNKDAFVQYVSPGQINVQAPADESSGTVQVVVTNAAGSSDPVVATLQQVAPAFFTSNKYVAATSAAGSVIASARAGDVISLYGNGFGPTTPSVAPGLVLQTAAPLASVPTVTIGGVQANVTFAGLSSTGLYQLNVTVPNVSAGDQEVIAQIAGQKTQSGVLLKVQ